MKKMLYLAAGLFVCLSATANEVEQQHVSANGLIETRTAAAWEDDGVVSGLKFFGTHVKGTVPGQFRIQYDSDSGKYRVSFRGNWYNVKTSDRQEFGYMFYADKTYYFNH